MLRGPQGTLYGRNSVGGTINIVTRQPTNALETSVRLTAGNYDKLRAEGAVSGPLIKDKVMGTVAFLRGPRRLREGSRSSRPLARKRGHLGRPRAAARRLREQRRAAVVWRLRPIRRGSAHVCQADCGKAGVQLRQPRQPVGGAHSHLASGKNTQQGGSAKLAIRLNATTTLNSLTAYRKSNYRFFIDADATELTVQTSDVPDLQRQVSQELTLVRRTSKLTWIGGAFFFDEHNEGQVEITVYPTGIQSRPFATFGTRPGRSSARPPTGVGRVSLTGGVRYTDEQKDLDNTGGVVPAWDGDPRRSGRRSMTSSTAPPTTRGRPRSASRCKPHPTRSSTSPPREVSRAADSTHRAEPGKAFSPEFAWSYEGGLKHTMAGGRVRVNTALFYTDYQDLQVQSFVRPGVLDISNAGIGDHQRHRSRGGCGGGARPAARGQRLVARGDLRPLSRRRCQAAPRARRPAIA